MLTHHANGATDPVAAVSSLANEAAGRGLRPPLQLCRLGEVTRGWSIVRGRGDALVADEFGDLWWGRSARNGVVLVVRRCWPEEASGLASAIHARVEEILGEASFSAP